jgi:uncharacterized protein YkwD
VNLIRSILDLFRPRPAPPAPTPPVLSGDDAERALLAAHNEARARNLRPPLRLDLRLCDAAQAHAELMAARGVLAHEGLGDGTPFDRMRVQGYFFTAAAENIAEGDPDAASVVAAWMGDMPHRANVLGDYTDLGGGMARSARGVPFFCCDYGRGG